MRRFGSSGATRRVGEGTPPEPGDACANGDERCERTRDQVRLDTRSAGVTTGRSHRRVLAVLGDGLVDPAGRDLAHTESVGARPSHSRTV
jgi:hypothetical protein